MKAKIPCSLATVVLLCSAPVATAAATVQSIAMQAQVMEIGTLVLIVLGGAALAIRHFGGKSRPDRRPRTGLSAPQRDQRSQ